MASPTPRHRADYRLIAPLATRWSDNDVYGHMNNVVYYALFDTVINRFLIERGGLDIANGEAIGLCVESGCSYLQPLAFPDALEGGLRVLRLGSSSVRYGVAIFRVGDEDAAAQGEFVHVFVDRETRRPVPVPDRLRAALAALA